MNDSNHTPQQNTPRLPNDTASDGARLLVFTAPWVAAWRVLERRLGDCSGIRVVNVEEEPGVADRYNVAALPTVVAEFPGGRQVRKVGAVSEEYIRETLRRVQD